MRVVRNVRAYYTRELDPDLAWEATPRRYTRDRHLVHVVELTVELTKWTGEAWEVEAVEIRGYRMRKDGTVTANYEREHWGFRGPYPDWIQAAIDKLLAVAEAWELEV